MTQLARYEAARAALEQAKSVDEAKSIRDKAVALEAYARQANDGALLEWAIEIRMRAERKAGALLKLMAETGERATRGGDRRSNFHGESLKLANIGVSHIQSHRWQRLASLEVEAFEQRVGVAKREIARSAEGTRAERQAEKKERRAAREAALGQKQCALPDKKYGVIYADPEWRFEPWSRESGMDRSPDNHYPTSCLEVIAARDVASIAAKDCVLALWVMGGMLPHGLVVMAAWGFDFKSEYVWRKDRIGMGYWSRRKHELLLIGTRGDIPCPAPGEQWDSCFDAPVGGHSEKPECVCEMLEAYFPNLPKIELNRRGPPRPGWDAWGNEAAPSKAA